MRQAARSGLPALLCLAVAAVGCGRPSRTAAGPPPATAPAPAVARPSSGVMDSSAWAAVADTVGMARIRFARGTTSGIVNDSLPADGERAYLVGALQGQVMLAHAIAWSDQGRGTGGRTSVRVYRADGTELPAPGGAGPLWSGRLPITGDYVVRVEATGGPAPYTLAVQIPRRVVLDRENPSASYSGLAPSRAPVDFLIRGERGRLLQVELRSEDRPSHLHIYGLDDGAQLSPLADRRQRYAGPFPSTQDYVVSVVPVGEGGGYELLLTVR
jgi:hypothetical protein